MRLIIIRHGDPDYSIDSLTERGREEAQLLAQRVKGIKAQAYYCSPLGRARDTAAPCMKELGKEAVVLPWLREFDGKVLDPKSGQPRSVVWDMMPAYWTGVDNFYHKDTWTDTDYIRTGEGSVENALKGVCDGLDAVIAKHGYVRSGRFYKTEQGNEDTVVFFCHFGVECVMLGHLLGISPVLLWHGTMAAPTSVTTLVTEEREKGVAYFRCLAFGDTSHLYAGGKENAFAGRFCEVYENFDQRH